MWWVSSGDSWIRDSSRGRSGGIGVIAVVIVKKRGIREVFQQTVDIRASLSPGIGLEFGNGTGVGMRSEPGMTGIGFYGCVLRHLTTVGNLPVATNGEACGFWF
jgi:hypothetical protein